MSAAERAGKARRNASWPADQRTAFAHSEAWLGPVGANQMGALLDAAADLLLVIDADGRVDDVASHLPGLAPAELAGWRGRAVEELVERGDVARLRRLLGAARAGRAARRQVLRHVTADGASLPMAYAALPVAAGCVLLLGRDQRGVVGLEARLLEERLERERAGRGLQRAEGRYRQLFECGLEALLLVDARGARILEANASALACFALPAPRVVGRSLTSLFGRGAREEVGAWLAASVAGGLARSLEVTRGRTRRPLRLTARTVGGEPRVLLAVGVQALDPPPVRVAQDIDARLAQLVRCAAEAVLLCDPRGTLLWANHAAVALLGAPDLATLVSRPLARHLAPTQLGMDVMLANLRRHRRLDIVPARLVDGRDVELAAIPMLDETPPVLGFILRQARPAADPAPGPDAEIFTSPERLAALIGSQPLKGMVRDATDRVERLCIEATLKLTGNNRALAAKLLGMSRQGLYLKLHHYGLAGAEDDAATAD